MIHRTNEKRVSTAQVVEAPPRPRRLCPAGLVAASIAVVALLVVPAFANDPEPRPQATLPPSAYVALSPGTYSSSAWVLRLTSDDFELRRAAGESLLSGEYDVEDGMLIMASDSDDQNVIRCRVGLFGPGIRLRDEDGTCRMLDGAVLEKDW